MQGLPDGRADEMCQFLTDPDLLDTLAHRSQAVKLQGLQLTVPLLPQGQEGEGDWGGQSPPQATWLPSTRE